MNGRPGTVVLMYHALDRPGRRSGASDPGEEAYVVDAGLFERQMRYLASCPAEVVTAGEKPSGPLGVIITFDDGHESNHSIALPLLRELGMKACFFVTTDLIGTEHCMTEEMIADLSASGMTVGSHGISHSYLSDLPPAMLAAELEGSRSKLEKITGMPVDSFSAPGGRIDGRVAEAAVGAGYRWIFGSRPAVNSALIEGKPAGRFAVMRGRSFGWFTEVVSGSPPPFETARYEILSLARRILGNRNYDRIRKAIFR